jgi:hypothetical protein
MGPELPGAVAGSVYQLPNRQVTIGADDGQRGRIAFHESRPFDRCWVDGHF